MTAATQPYTVLWIIEFTKQSI